MAGVCLSDAPSPPRFFVSGGFAILEVLNLVRYKVCTEYGFKRTQPLLFRLPATHCMYTVYCTLTQGRGVRGGGRSTERRLEFTKLVRKYQHD